MPNFDDLLKKKTIKKENTENKENSNLKSRMRNVVNASKLLDSDTDFSNTPNAKKEALKAKLAKAMEDNKVLDDQFASEVDEDSLNEKKRQEEEKEIRKKQLAEKQQKALEKLALLEKEDNTDETNKEQTNKEQTNKEQTNEEQTNNINNVKIIEVVKEKPVEVIRQVPVEIVREVPIEKIVEKEVIKEVVKEVPVEVIKEVPVEKIVYINNNVNNDETVNKEQDNEKKTNIVLDFFMKTMNGMAYGLFATLIIGTILGATLKISFIKDNEIIYNFIKALSDILSWSLGLGIGIGVAYNMGFKDIKLIALGITGFLANYFCGKAGEFFVLENCTLEQIGDPLTIYVTVALTALLMKLIFRKKTSVDIIIIPLFGAILGSLISYCASPGIRYVTTAIGNFIETTAELHPFAFGIIIAVVMGMALTAPISSAAIAAIVFNGSSIAAGAAVIGCSVQMVGFAVQAAHDNKFGTVFSIGIGTSMLEFKNILKKPIIWLPTILTSAILGPIGTCLLNTKCAGVSAGMGTSGLVGIIGTIDAMNGDGIWNIVLSVAILEVVAPIILVFLFDFILRKLKLIKPGDLKL